MSAVAPNTASFRFMALPNVLKTMVTTYVPKNDLGINSAVSKQFKTVVEGNFIWEKFAKEMQIDIKDQQNVKHELITKYGEEVKKANATIIAILPEKEKLRLSAINNPFDQKKEIVGCLRTLMAAYSQNRSDKIYRDIVYYTENAYSNFFDEENLVNKTVLVMYLEGVGATLETSDHYPRLLNAGEKNPEIFKAYIKGCKANGNDLSIAVSNAILRWSPLLLKHLIQEGASLKRDHILEVIYNIVFSTSAEQDKVALETLSIVLDAFPLQKWAIQYEKDFARPVAWKALSKEITVEAAKDQIKKHLNENFDREGFFPQ